MCVEFERLSDIRSPFHTLATLTAAAALLAFAPPVIAGPQGGEVVSGSAAITSAGAATTITQSSQKAIINWTGFSVGANESVTFAQPSYTSATLNRVTGNEKSVIDGALSANGQVFIVNSAGVLFGKSAQVNVGALVASTRDIANEDFLAGRYTFSGTSSGSVVNQGTIATREGGYVSLLGKTVSNEGAITATLGTVALASGDKITLNFEGDALADITIDKGTLDALVANKQAIKADGGRVILSAKAADSLVAAQVNNTSIIQARTLADLTGGSSRKGSIKLLAQGGKTAVSGTLDASAPSGGDGGFIETSGDKVAVADGAAITTAAASGLTGTWLIDPTDFAILYGADALTTSGIGVATLQNLLANSNITIVTSSSGTGSGNIDVEAPIAWTSGNSLKLAAYGDINVNNTIAWSAGTLTLNAGKNISVNAAITASGTAAFVANYGNAINADGSVSTTATAGKNSDGTPWGLYAGFGQYLSRFDGLITLTSTTKVTLNGTPYTVITDAAGLAAVKNTPSGYYVLGADISNTNWSDGIGSGTAFTGVFNGFGHVISSPTLTGTGLFGTIGSSGSVTNVGISSATVNAPASGTVGSVGTLANVNQGLIANVFVYGGSVNNNATSALTVSGGLVGTNYGLIADAYSGATVTAGHISGGFIGVNASGGTISESWAYYTGNVSSGTGTDVAYVGGFVGENDGAIVKSFANNSVRLSSTLTSTIAGEFVGKNTGTIDQAYSAGPFIGSLNYGTNLAGFVGENTATGRITNAYTTNLYSTSPTSNWAAGFAYINAGTISNSYATGYVSTAKTVSGFAATNTGTISNAYYYVNGVSGFTVTSTTGATALSSTTAPLLSSYSGFDSSIWSVSARGFPILSNTPVYVWGYSNAVYGATNSVDTLVATISGRQGGGGYISDTTLDNTAFTLALDNGYVDAGGKLSSAIVSSSAFKNIKGNIKVAPLTLTVTTTADQLFADKVYDGTTKAGTLNDGLLTVSGFASGQSFTLKNLTGVYSDANVGTNKTVTLLYSVDSVVGGAKSSNYTIAATTAAITPKTLTVVGVTVSDKVYDGTTAAVASNAALTGVISGDVVSLASGYAASFTDANAGSNKSVLLSGLSLTGAKASNYTIASTQTVKTTAAITPRALVLSGSKIADGTASISGAAINASNLIKGDTVTLSGTARLGGSSSGVQAITSVSGLRLDNANYTLVGAVGSVYVGSANLALDHIASGTADIASSDKTTTITTSDKAIIDWYRFSVASGETVSFVQPSSSSVVLNRVTGSEASLIDGALNANGRVFILNSNGVLFGAGSVVNVGALVASTQALADDDFLAGKYVFTVASGKGSVVAKGDIVIVDGGFLALLSQNGVTTSGTITARNGKAILASAKSLTLDLDASANGLSSYAVSDLSGATSAGGAIRLASAGTGGLLETAGVTVSSSNLALSTGRDGTWSWSQSSINVGSGGLTSTLVNSALAARNFELHALTGDLTVSSPIVWSSDSTLTLAASKNIAINANVTATGANAGLVMNYGGDYSILTPASYSGTVLDATGKPVANSAPTGTAYASVTLSGANATLKINDKSYTLIHSIEQLDALDGCIKGLCYNPATGKYDVSAASISSKIAAMKSVGSYIGGVYFYYNPSTGNYDIPLTTTDTSGATKYWNPETKVYDLDSQYSGKVYWYYYDVSTGSYPYISYNYTAGKYYNPATGSYDLASMAVGSNYYYNTITKTYDIFDYNATAGRYYNPQTKAYDLSQRNDNIASYYYNTASGAYDLLTPAYVTGNYALAQNLDASGTTYAHAVVSNFSGTFTGLGHTISNLTLSVSQEGAGLFGTVGQWTRVGSTDIKDIGTTTIRDIGVENLSITSTASSGTSYPAGALAAYSYGSILNAWSSGSITSQNNYAGGLVGVMSSDGSVYLTLRNVKSSVTVAGAAYVGGLAGSTSYVNISNASATGNVSGATSGGLVGSASGTNVSNSYARGNGGTGGLIGSWGGVANTANAISNSFATGNAGAGGLVGALSSSVGGSTMTISNSYATGNVSVSFVTDPGYSGSVGIGGLVGSVNVTNATSTVTIVNSFATGDVSYTADYGNNAGGLVGSWKANGTIDHSYATGDVTGGPKGTGAGGLIGTASAADNNATHLLITNVSASGDVKGAVSAGGLIASGGFTLRNATATGNVTLDLSSYKWGQAGGLVGGINSGAIINSSASGNVSTNAVAGQSYTYMYLGGIAGYNQGVITNVSASGDVSGFGNTATNGPANTTGGLVGWNNRTGAVTYSSATGTVTFNGAPSGNAIGGNTSTGTVSSNSYVDAKAVAAAEFAAFKAEAAATGAHVTGSSQNTVSRDDAAKGDPAASAAGTQAVASAAGPDVAASIEGAPSAASDEEDRRRRQAASVGARRAPDANYDARLKSIEVEGKRFDLEAKPDAGGATAPQGAPSAPAPKAP
ncbi:two-partner secretion domain-containing protein [Rhodomicrobium lacus]|uniref:two-partner secretion domain-containing protein n=1 Tax=Rhodomicrobium lacus TaxID=2498452 RepID=UPI0026E22A8E|nr:filamentous hemagglutinin N-terminal domain-containing protein [Rhodomicrobium lacus]WKW51488.1 filamentous hemagglutinin N-terminal domain-containing protein [Rhodomicrobium lacus]